MKGVEDSLWTWWHEDGPIKTRATLVNCLKEGKQPFWAESGRLLKEEYHEKGELIKEEIF